MTDFLIADTFTDSLARLSGDEQKQVKTTAFDLQLDPSNPGMKLHRLDKAKDENFWSVRVSGDLRLIVHRNQQSLLLCYVNHHDKAYDWGERRTLQTHPTTGAAQLVEIRETVKEIVVPTYVEAPPTPVVTPPLFANRSDEELLQYGVPAEWLADVREATEDSLLILADRLPSEAAEALLEVATGGTPKPLQVLAQAMPGVEALNPFDHPDAQRRFRVMTNVEELERALEFPWDKWSVFLHPEQRQFVEQTASGPARVSGSAGTGKTIVVLHRAVFLARTHPDARVLLTTFSDTLAHALQTQLKRLVSHEPRLAERLDVRALNAVGERLYKSHIGQAHLASREVIRDLVRNASAAVADHAFSLPFLMTEWEQVVDAWKLDTWETYRDVVRLGRKTRLLEPQRRVLWSIFEHVRAGLVSQSLITRASLFTALADAITDSKHPPFDFTVVDESQDLGVAHLRFLSSLGRHRPDALFFPATSGSGSSKRRSPGSPWESIFGDGQKPCGSITAHRIRSAPKRTSCSTPRSSTPTATLRNAVTPCLCLMGHLQTSWSQTLGSTKFLGYTSGLRTVPTRASRRMSVESLFGLSQRWNVPGQRYNKPACPPRCWMTAWHRHVVMWQSAPCIWRRG